MTPPGAPADPNGHVSHGICPPCLDRVNAELDTEDRLRRELLDMYPLDPRD